MTAVRVTPARSASQHQAAERCLRAHLVDKREKLQDLPGDQTDSEPPRHQ